MRNDSPASLPYVRCIAWIVVLGLIVPATVPATASAQERRVVVVPGLEPGDLAALTDQGAVGLLVPDAGPKTSGARARAALERGAVRNSVLGGLPEGEARLDVETAGAVPPGLRSCSGSRQEASSRTTGAIRSPSWARATAGSSPPNRRGFPVSSRSWTSLRRHSARRARSGRRRTTIRSEH